jgi:hypothetical protein
VKKRVRTGDDDDDVAPRMAASLAADTDVRQATRGGADGGGTDSGMATGLVNDGRSGQRSNIPTGGGMGGVTASGRPSAPKKSRLTLAPSVTSALAAALMPAVAASKTPIKSAAPSPPSAASSEAALRGAASATSTGKVGASGGRSRAVYGPPPPPPPTEGPAPPPAGLRRGQTRAPRQRKSRSKSGSTKGGVKAVGDDDDGDPFFVALALVRV